MSAKQCHRLRALQRERDYYEATFLWLKRKPSAIHFIQRFIWWQREPRRIDF